MILIEELEVLAAQAYENSKYIISKDNNITINYKDLHNLLESRLSNEDISNIILYLNVIDNSPYRLLTSGRSLNTSIRLRQTILSYIIRYLYNEESTSYISFDRITTRYIFLKILEIIKKKYVIDNYRYLKCIAYLINNLELIDKIKKNMRKNVSL